MWTRAVMACYVIWGLLPLLYAMLAPAGAAELVASRIVWGFGLCMAIVAIHGQTRAVLDILRNPRALVITAASAALLGLNWGTHIVAILTGQVVDAGIGYLLTPLLSVILGAIVLRQRLSVQQWLGVALAGAALLVIGAGYGSVPWVVLLLPLSWAIYGLVKQKFPIEAPVLVSFTAELSLLAPIGFGLLAWLGLTGQATTWTWCRSGCCSGTPGPARPRPGRPVPPTCSCSPPPASSPSFRCSCSTPRSGSCAWRRSGCCSTSRRSSR